jgi:hypothetical protein
MKKWLFVGGFFLLFLTIFFLNLSSSSWEKECKRKIKRGEPPFWASAQIEEDLRFFKKTGISKELLDRTMQCDKGDLRLVRFTIHGKEVSMTCHEAEKASSLRMIIPIRLHEALKKLSNTVVLPDLDFIVTIQDALFEKDLPGPVFAFAKNAETENKVILMPDHEALLGYVKELKKVSKGKKKYPWSQKVSKAFWRGATNYPSFNSSEFLKFPRSILTSLSLKFPEHIDSRYTMLVECKDPQNVQSAFGDYFGNFEPIQDHLRYKYQLLVDGFTCAYARAYWQLFSECPIFKVHSPNIQWYYKGFIPHQHYIPIQADGSDLIEKIEWAQKNEKTVQEIAQNAYQFAQKNLKYADIMYYFYLVLSEYAKLQHF